MIGDDSAPPDRQIRGRPAGHGRAVGLAVWLESVVDATVLLLMAVLAVRGSVASAGAPRFGLRRWRSTSFSQPPLYTLTLSSRTSRTW
jgi:hypothetical protein